MNYLFAGKKYADSLFFGHIVLEKIIKTHVVKDSGKETLKVHDLLYLADLSKLNLSNDEIKYLKIVNRFNMRTRYPDIKLTFYKQCTRQYIKEHLEKIEKLYKKLCQELKSKK